MSDTCKLCRFVLANTRGDGKYRCANQESPRFGQKTGPDFCNDNYSGGCPQYAEFDPMPDMSFKDALELLVMLPRGAYPTWFFKFGQQGELKRPFYVISFENNKQMLDWRDAHQVCFDELMRIKREAGDFEDSEESKGENDG